jgi:hypothetical protein
MKFAIDVNQYSCLTLARISKLTICKSVANGHAPRPHKLTFHNVRKEPCAYTELNTSGSSSTVFAC